MAKPVSGKGKTGSVKGKPRSAPVQDIYESESCDRNVLLIRVLTATVLAFLGLFLLLSMVGVQGAVLNLLRKLFRGLFGYGYWLMPIAFFLIAWLLVFKNHEPARLRSVSLLLITVLFSALWHSVFAKLTFENGLLPTLWQTGVEGASGGVLPGLIAQGMIYCLSRAGTIPVLVLLLVVFVFLAFRISAAQLIHKQAEKRREIMELEELNAPEPVVLTQAETMEDLRILAASMPKPKLPEIHRRNQESFDIPLDDDPPVKKASRLIHGPRDEELDEDLVFLSHEDKPRQERKKPAPAHPSRSPFDIPIGEIETVPSQPAFSACEQTEEEENEYAVDLGDEFMELPWDSLVTIKTARVDYNEELTDQELEQASIEAAQTGKVTKDDAHIAAAEVALEIQENTGGENQEAVPYNYPPMTMLAEAMGAKEDNTEEMRTNVHRLEETLESFGVHIKIENVVRGPTVTRYEMRLNPGVKFNKITGLHEDIALALGVGGIRIAAVPGKNSVIGIEVPNRNTTSVPIREVLSSREFTNHKSNLAFAIGKDIGGNYIVGDIAKMPHLLIAGTTGSGKSVCMNSIIVSLLYRATPEQCRMIMIDPKVVELSVYNGIPHLLIPVVTEAKKAAGALQWAVTEMERRYKLLADCKVRDMSSYNKLAKSDPRLSPMPQIVVIIDELADLMMVAAKEVENSIVRIAQKARAAGMYLVIATQRPSADVITGLMKSNIPSRIAFAVASAIDSRIILDESGAEKLVGKGDMLYSPIGGGKPKRVQGCFITDEEVENIVEHIKGDCDADYSEEILKEIEQNSVGDTGTDEDPDQMQLCMDVDELFPEAVDVILSAKQASVSTLQRRIKVGYARAGRIMDEMEAKGIVGPFVGSKPRKILITQEQWDSMVGLNPRASAGKTDIIPEDDDVPFDEDE